jgi:hypothetical protein
MKLISKQKDYYDFWAKDRLYSDQNYRWERESRVVRSTFALPEPEVFTQGRLWIGRSLTCTTEVYLFVVFFCGRAIPIARLFDHGQTWFVGSFEDIPDRLMGDPSRNEFKKYRRYSHWGEPKFRQTAKDFFELGSKPWMSTHFEASKFPKIEIVEMHRILNSPIFCREENVEVVRSFEQKGEIRKYVSERTEGRLMVNPVLSDIGFQKILDPFTAFQELERFLANDLAPRDVRMDQPVPDKINAESHGFDKMSFRKESTKK